MPRPPKPGAVSGKTAVADVHHGDPKLLSERDFEVAEHVAKPRLTTDRDGRPCRERLFGGYGCCQAESECGDIAPTQKTAWYQRVIDGAQLIASIARFMGDERVMRIQHLHEIAIHPIRVDRLVVGCHRLPVLGKSRVPCRLDFSRNISGRPPGTGRSVGYFLDQGLQGEARVSDHCLSRRVDIVDVQFIHVAMDDGLLDGVRYRVAESTGR